MTTNFNITKGQLVGLHKRVDDNDPANSAIIVIPLEAAGLVADSVMRDYDSLAAILAGATNEQTTMGRKILTDADIAAITINDTDDRAEISLPAILWALASGNDVGAFLVCYDPDTTGGSDSDILPMTVFDFTLSPDGTNFTLNAGVYGRAN